MLEKNQLEKYLSRCMASDADFAEIYETVRFLYEKQGTDAD